MTLRSAAHRWLGPISTLGTPMALFSAKTLPMGHSGAYTASARTNLCAGCDLRADVLAQWGPSGRGRSESFCSGVTFSKLTL
jgi:hypothetical protein